MKRQLFLLASSCALLGGCTNGNSPGMPTTGTPADQPGMPDQGGTTGPGTTTSPGTTDSSMPSSTSASDQKVLQDISTKNPDLAKRIRKFEKGVIIISVNQQNKTMTVQQMEEFKTKHGDRIKKIQYVEENLNTNRR